jgi:hypothetical protein
MDDVWTAEQLALQVMVWQMVRDGAVRGAQLASEFERNARFAPRDEGYPLVILACLARAASRPELAEDCIPAGNG